MSPSGNSLVSMDEAVSRIRPGDSLAMGLALEHVIPFAVGHEIIRQQIDGLTLIGPISDMLFDRLVGAGLVDKIQAAWVGNVSAGSGYCFRRAVEGGELDMEDHSNFSLALSLEAGRLGVPYLPTHSLLGTDILEENDRLIRQEDPFTGKPTVLVPAINPDWTVIHVQRADARGNAHFWGNKGVLPQAVGAADRVLVTAEEIVSTDVIKSDPDRILVTSEKVPAVVECPFGAHPSSVAGYYDRHHQFYMDYNKQTRSEEGFNEWADEWVFGVSNHDEYMERVNDPPVLTDPSPAAEVNYGQ